MTILRVVTPGGAASIQDAGRPGYQRHGVSEAGAMDRLALALANGLVGNAAGEACIEFALFGGTYAVADGGCRIAVAGCDLDIRVQGERILPYRAVDLAPGATIAIGRVRSGTYGYLAVAGGFDLAPVLGSRSVHARSGIGGGPLGAGTALVLRPSEAPAGAPLALDSAHWPRADGPIRVVWGPQEDAFTAAGRAAFLGGDYRIGAQWDRMGFRLEGPAIEHAAGFNIVSDGIVLGSIQVPGTCQPIVLLADRQTTGGYPKIATVISADIRRLVQRGQGAPLRFVAVSPEAADAAARDAAAALRTLVARMRPAADPHLLDSARLLGLNLVDGFVAGER